MCNGCLQGKAGPGMNGSGLIHPTKEILPLGLGITCSGKDEFSSLPWYFFLWLIAATPDIPNSHPSLFIPGLAVFRVPLSPQNEEFHREITALYGKTFFFYHFFQNPRIPELFQMEKPSKAIKSKHSPALPSPPLSHVPKCHIHTPRTFKAFIPCFCRTNFPSLFLQAICHLPDLKFPCQRYSLCPLTSSVEKWTQVWGWINHIKGEKVHWTSLFLSPY